MKLKIQDGKVELLAPGDFFLPEVVKLAAVGPRGEFQKAEEAYNSVVLKLATRWNHLGSFKEQWCLGLTPRDSDLIGFGGGLGIRIFKSSPGNSNVQPRLRITTKTVTGSMPHCLLLQVNIAKQMTLFCHYKSYINTVNWYIPVHHIIIPLCFPCTHKTNKQKDVVLDFIISVSCNLLAYCFAP